MDWYDMATHERPDDRFAGRLSQHANFSVGCCCENDSRYLAACCSMFAASVACVVVEFAAT